MEGLSFLPSVYPEPAASERCQPCTSSSCARSWDLPLAPSGSPALKAAFGRIPPEGGSWCLLWPRETAVPEVSLQCPVFSWASELQDSTARHVSALSPAPPSWTSPHVRAPASLLFLACLWPEAVTRGLLFYQARVSRGR